MGEQRLPSVKGKEGSLPGSQYGSGFTLGSLFSPSDSSLFIVVLTPASGVRAAQDLNHRLDTETNRTSHYNEIGSKGALKTIF